MAGETELERIVVRLIGDGSSFSKMMTNAVGVTQKATTQMITALNRVEGFANTLLGAFGSLGVASSLKGAFEQFAKMERGQIRLNSIIETNGGNVQELTTRYKAVAEAISAVTLNTKGEVLALFQQAEAQQFSGDAAENVVRNSIALAGATGQSAESMVRVAAMMQRGHPEFAKRILGLRGVADGAALVDAINKRMTGGMALAQAEFNSASGKMERLGRSMKSVGTEIGGLIAGALLPVVSVIQNLTEEFKKLDPTIKNMTYKIVGMVLAWMSLGPVTSVLRGLFGPLLSLVKLVTLDLFVTIKNTAAWLIHGTVVAAVTVIITAFKAAAMTLLIVLEALKVALAISTVAFTGLFVVIAGAGFFAVVAVWKTFLGVLSEVSSLAVGIGQVFQGMTTLAQPLDHISAIFGEWWDILKKVYQVAQSDLPLAWQLLEAGLALAVNQIKDLWPPLWSFIREGFTILLNWLKDELDITFTGIAQRARIAALRAADPLGLAEPAREREERENERSQRALRNQIRDRAQNALGQLQFANPEESLGTQNARDAVQELLADITALDGPTAQAAQRAGTVIGGALKKGMSSELKKFDAALFGTAEALARIDDYIDMYHGLKPRSGGQAGITPTTFVPPAGGGAGLDADGEILAQIRDTLVDISNRDTNVLMPAEFA